MLTKNEYPVWEHEANYQALPDAPWKKYRAVDGDNLRLRQLILCREGRQTLHNFILGDHNRPNRY